MFPGSPGPLLPVSSGSKFPNAAVPAPSAPSVLAIPESREHSVPESHDLSVSESYECSVPSPMSALFLHQ